MRSPSIIKDGGLIHQIQEEYAEGHGYFLYLFDVASVAGLMTALKAFSVFKKWQRSSLKMLVMATGSVPASEQAVEMFRLYKYRADVVFLNHLTASRQQQLTAAAYCVLTGGCQPSLCAASVQALGMQVPVITADSPEARSFFKEDTIYSPWQADALADRMMFVYKEEAVVQNHLQQLSLIHI